MNNFRNYMISFALVILLVTLCNSIYTGLEDNYNIVRDEGQTKNLFERIMDLNLMKGIDKFTSAVMRLIPSDDNKINWFNPLDVLGSLAAAGIGALQTIGGLITLPGEILTGVTGIPGIDHYYFIPPGIAAFIGSVVLITLLVMLLQAYVKPFHPL